MTRRPFSFATSALGTIALTLAVMTLAACKPKPLPEADSVAASLYVQHCGSCHRPYNPRTMTAAMWEMQVDMMDQKIRAAGKEPLTADERRIILDYLSRNAGKR